jgi:hypothetical protein
MQWPGIQIPQAIISLLDTKDLLVDFIDDNGGTEQHYIQFYERNPAGRGLDFDNAPEDKPDFVRYAVELRCLNPITDTRKTPLPPLEDLAAATKTLLAAGLEPEKAPRKDFLNILQKSGNTKEWFPDPYGPSTRDLRLNNHLGAGAIMTPGRIQDPKGAKTIVASFKFATGAITTIQRQTLRFVCYIDTNSGRLRIDMAATTGEKQNPSLIRRRLMLIYRTHMHPESSLDPEHCTPKSDARARSS